MTFNVRDGQGAQALDINSLLAQLQGQAIISGGTVTAAAGAFVVELEATAVYLNGTRFDIAEQTLDLDPYLDTDNGNPRKAVLYVDTDGEVQVAPGDPAPPRPRDQHRFDTYRPAPRDLSHTDAVPLAEVWLDPADTRLTDADLLDRGLSADLAANSFTAEVGDFEEIVDGAGVSHTGELADMDAVRSESEIRNAINTDATHGTDASHDYFSGAHGDLSGISTDNHHLRYDNSEARDAVRGAVDAADLTGASGAAGDHLEYTGSDVVWSPPPTQQATALASGTITHTGGGSTTVLATGVTSDETAQFDVAIGVASDPAFDADYAYSADVCRQWDDTNGQVDIEFTLTWADGLDPGSGNDIDLDWTAWDTAPAVVEGRYSDSDAVAAISGATIEPASALISGRLNPPIHDELANAASPTLGDIAIASGDGSDGFGQYIYDGSAWAGPLGTSVSALSDINIDVPKDWGGFRIPNVGAPSAATDAARQQELTDHAAADDAHHAPTTGSDIDHTNIANVQPDQHHSPPSDDDFVAAASGRVYSLPLTAAEIPSGEYLRNYLRVDSGQTLTLVRGECVDDDGAMPSGLSLQLYDRTNDTVVYEQSDKLATASSSDPLATISGGVDVEARIANTTGNAVAAGGVVSYYY